MTNREKFSEQILDIVCNGGSFGLNKENNTIMNCGSLTCIECKFYNDITDCNEVIKEWCNSEYVEPTIDWSKVPVDTPILVKTNLSDLWTQRYFAKYENNKICAWNNGATSWSEKGYTYWVYAKLAEENPTHTKETPIKPTETYSDKAESIWCTCGACGAPFGWKENIKFKYCSECGQKIDLSDEE